MKLSIFLLAMMITLLPSLARADDTDEDEGVKVNAGKSSPDLGGKSKIIYRKRTAVSFDDAVVEGSANNPEGVYVVTPPDVQTGGLLKLRPNFHRELMRDALLLK
jgi:hypothetical protein